MAAYLIVEVTDISDEVSLAQYVEQVQPLLERYGARYIARGPAHVLEGKHQPQRLVIIEFPSMERIQALYDADEYAPLKALRQRGSSNNFLAVEGL
jgi:uncharacterized protein (DUF1330 family)